MNNRNSLSAEQKQFCDNLLAYAEWLDSNYNYFVSDFNRYRDAFNLKHLKINLEQIKNVFGVDVDIYNNFYSQNSTNAERVLAVLLLRSAILAGDSFTNQENV